MQNLYEEVHGGRGGGGKIFHTFSFFSGGGEGGRGGQNLKKFVCLFQVKSQFKFYIKNIFFKGAVS